MLLKDQVVLITGAGNGIGRAYALAFAAAGARVVVNDLGGARDGDGASDAPARTVVQEIVALGGDAIADFGNVTVPADCARMVEAAVTRWGRLDTIVNNAGVLRDRTFSKLTDEEWDIVVAVHLTGTRNVVRAALPALSRAGGSIINTTSYSGMIGNFGQANYAAAKAGIYGFTRVLAVELQRANITANCIAPIAKTRMTEDIDRIGDDWTPTQIAPVAVFLASPLARKVTGKVLGVAGQRIHMYEVQTNEGVEKAGSELWTAEAIAAKYEDISAFAATVAPAASASGAASPVRDVFALAPKAFRADRAGDLAMRLHFAISDAPGQTLIVKDGKAWVEDGLTGSPDCTMKTDAATIIGIFKQTVDATKAFMKGKITADNLPIVMKFAAVFDFSTPRPEAAAPPAATAEPAPVQKKWPIGKDDPDPVVPGEESSESAKPGAETTELPKPAEAAVAAAASATVTATANASAEPSSASKPEPKPVAEPVLNPNVPEFVPSFAASTKPEKLPAS